MKRNLGAVVNLIHYKDPKEEIKYSNDDFTVFHLSIKDIPTNTIEWCEQGSKFIEDQIEKGKCVYVHCIYGISRSSTQIMHFLMTKENKTLKEAFDYLRTQRHVVCPTLGFMKGLSELDEKLHGKVSFSPEEYAYLAISEVLPHIPMNEIKRVYAETKKEVEANIEMWTKRRNEENIEPVGFLCYDKLFELHGRERLIQRFGCSVHHPFD